MMLFIQLVYYKNTFCQYLALKTITIKSVDFILSDINIVRILREDVTTHMA